MAENTLPSLIVLGSVKNDFGNFFEETGTYSRLYLGCVTKGSEFENYLKYDFKATDPAAKFAIEPAESGGGLVHIKSCYHNMFLSRKDENTGTIVAEASEAVEDKSTWKCTLFEPKISGSSEGEQTVVFRHVQSDSDVHIADDSFDGPRNFLTVDKTAGESRKLAESVFVDCDYLLSLPKYVAFQAHNRDLYLKPMMMAILYFEEKDTSSEGVVHEVHPTPDGTARFKHLQTGKFWVPATPFFMAMGEDGTQSPTVFNVVNLDADNSIVALRIMYTKTYCISQPDSMILADGNTKTITKECWFRVVEPVLKRKVKVNFHLDDAKIYNQSVDTMAEASGYNDSYVETDEIGLEKTVEYTESNTWSNSVGLTTGVETSFETGIPFIAEGTITVSVEASYEHQWEETQAKTYDITAHYTMNLEPRTKGTIKLVATKATCEIPFSYTQTDTLYSGQKVTTNLKDGVYTGVQYYNFNYETHRESMDEDIPRVETLVIPHPCGR